MAQHLGSIWLDNNWTTLPNNLWVAATGSGIVEENRSFERLINALRLMLQLPLAWDIF